MTGLAPRLFYVCNFNDIIHANFGARWFIRGEMQQDIFYRPEWTCGRYNVEHKVAIMYNLIEGMSYLFEDASALVIGRILDVERNATFSIHTLSQKTGISEASLIAFTEPLKNANLITDAAPTSVDIQNYRKAVGSWRKSQNSTAELSHTQEQMPVQITTAERDYMERVGGVTSVMFEMTYNCSEKCIHCYNIGATRNDDEQSHRGDSTALDLDDYKRIIDQLYDEGLVKVCLSGGDPFSNPYTWDVIDYLYKKNVAIDIFTNGLRLVGHEDRLLAYHPRKIGVSIYSSQDKVHDYITRIPGSWKKSMGVIEKLCCYGTPMDVKCCVMRPNVKTYRGVADIAKKNGAMIQYEVDVTDSIDGDACASSYLRLTKEQYKIVLRDINVPLYVGKELQNYGGMKRAMEGSPCGAGEHSFCITPDGKLIACCAFHLSFGDLCSQSLHSILENSERLNQWNNINLSDYEECGRHDYCNYCNLCSGQNLAQQGSYLKACTTSCELAKIRHEMAMDMMAGRDPLDGMSIDEALDALPDYNAQRLHRRN